MQVEIIYSGLCSFLNMKGTNPTMPEPSVILVRAEHQPNGNGNGNGTGNGVPNGGGAEETHHHEHGAVPRASRAGVPVPPNLNEMVPQSAEARDGVAPAPAAPAPAGLKAEAVEHNGHNGASHLHIPFIAFDTRKVRIENATGFQPVDRAPDFKFLPLDGVRLSIDGDPPGNPKVDHMYRFVVNKDDYWPEAKNQWNRDLVPERGKRPKKSAVAAFMRFGGGKISADRISQFEYKFKRNDGTEFSDFFAEEVLYQFDQEDDCVEIELRDLETNKIVQVLEFWPAGHEQKVSLFIGNNMPDAMDDAVNRTPRLVATGGDHFSFLNLVASPGVATPGPTATAMVPPPPSPATAPGGFVERAGGGGSAGFCGPGNANGG